MAVAAERQEAVKPRTTLPDIKLGRTYLFFNAHVRSHHFASEQRGVWSVICSFACDPSPSPTLFPIDPHLLFEPDQPSEERTVQ